MNKILLSASLAFVAYSGTVMASVHQYDISATSQNPATQGWVFDPSRNGSSSLDLSLGEPLWSVDGRDGRSEWEFAPSSSLNSLATSYGWHYHVEMAVQEGGYMTNYYANGQKRYLPIVSLSNGQLLLTLEGVSGDAILVASGSAATSMHRYDVVGLPNQGAQVYVDGALVASNWQGAVSSQNVVVWGNGSTGTAGRALYRKVSFEVHGDAVFSSPDRIPSVMSAGDARGVVAIFAERRLGGGDPGSTSNTNDIMARVSHDGGVSFGAPTILSAELNSSNQFDFSDPRPIYLPSRDAILVSYAKWPTDAGQNNDVIKPWLDNAIIQNEYSLASQSWSAPQLVPNAQVKEQGLQLIGWQGSVAYERMSNLQPTDTWRLEASVRIAHGAGNTLSVGNGQRQFRIEFIRAASGDLRAKLNGQANESLVKSLLQAPYAEMPVTLEFNPNTGFATVKVDGDVLASDWQGELSSDAMVRFGNTDAVVDGRMLLGSIRLQRDSSELFYVDARALTTVNPASQNTALEANGWTRLVSGKGYNFYGDASINPGPGHGIVLSNQTSAQGGHNGRMLYPAIQLDKYFLNVVTVLSDDQGSSWRYGDELPLPYQWSGSTLKTLEPSEADVVELTNGQLLLTVRLDFNQIVNGVNYGPRYQFTSHNGGETWQMLVGNGANMFPGLSTGTVDASISRFVQADGSSYLMFTNPIGDLATHSGRSNLGLWISKDEGQSWQGPIQLVNGGSAYSDIVQLNSEQAFLIFEDNSNSIRTMRLPIPLLKQLL